MTDYKLSYSDPHGFIKETISLPRIKEDELLILPLKACFCGSDLFHIENNTSGAPSFGHEWIGKIIEIGNNVTKMSVGDYVTSAAAIPCGKCNYCNEGNTNLCNNSVALGTLNFGVLQSQTILPEHFLIKVNPNQVQDAEMLEVMAVGEEVFLQTIPLVEKEKSNIIIIGAGPVGVSIAIAFEEHGYNVTIAEKRSQRIEWAKNFCKDVKHAYKMMMLPQYKEYFDIIIDASAVTGNDIGAQKLYGTFSRANSKIIVVGKYKDINHFPHNLFSIKGMTIRFITGIRKKTFEENLDLLYKRVQIFSKKYITHYFNIENINEAFNLFREKDYCGKISIQINENQ